MKTITQTIPLPHAGSTERIVKRGALATFKFLRAASAQSAKLPAVLAQATADVRSAWQESAVPKQ